MSERDAVNPDELRLELEGLRAENRRLRSLLGLDVPERATTTPPPEPDWEPTLFRDASASTGRVPVDNRSTPESKVALFRSLFAGRDDVYAARWENERSGKSGWSPVVVGGRANARRPDREYVEKERLRLSTWKTPRFLRCYGESFDRLLLPRGLREAAETIIAEAGSRFVVREKHPDLARIEVQLQATLPAGQQDALDALCRHDLGVLVAPPGAGKTVLACAVIAHRAVPTLVIVDRQPLLEQWRERLVTHLDVNLKQIGVVGSGRSRPHGVVDIAMVQSLARRDDVAGLTAGYGFVVVDECHHVPATTFERVVREIGAPAWLGLTATPYRRDGLEGLITMYCGPIRHRMGERQNEDSDFVRALVVHRTDHVAAPAEAPTPAGMSIQSVFRGLVQDEDRTRLICADVASAVRAGRNCLVLSQWTEHIARLGALLAELGIEADVLKGGVGKKARRVITDRLAGARSGDGVALLATGSFLGEGFDCRACPSSFPRRAHPDLQADGPFVSGTVAALRLVLHWPRATLGQIETGMGLT
jgi:hypothetical protein